uniref:Conserved oligomeric Golgi complex subunit 8 n=1 Tax=Pseudo-nitzschia australis TaxID=44445 RepID=A0A7S4AIA0_9STRA
MTDVDERVAAKAGLEAAEEELQSLCASHAGTFVSVERRGRALEVSLEGLLATVQSVESIVVSTQEALEQEEEDGPGRARENSLAALSEKHRVRRRTLLQHSSLLELLELPSLMDACVRSNLYEEALSIAAFANTLERRHTEKNQVVVKVIAQVRSRQSDLRRYLLHSLKNQVTMPECLEIVTALRRLNSIDLERLQSGDKSNVERVFAAMELSLQVDFLEARDTWLDQPTTAATVATNYTTSSARSSNTSKAMLSHSTSEQLLDTIERYRTRMFEIATQFNAIFRAQQTSHISNSSSTSDGSSNPNSNNDGHVSVSLLSMWATRRIHSFLKILSSQLQLMDESGSLRDALDACIFFTGSMGRLGADFTAQLPPLFEQRLLSIVVNNWKEGTNQLAETLKICREAGVAAPLFSSTVVPTGTSSSSSSSAITTTDDEGNEEGHSSTTIMMPPPRNLMALPPLGRLVNACLTGLNELRRCLLPGIFSQLREAIEKEFLLETKNILHSHERAVMTPGLRGDAAKLRENAKDMKNMTKTIVFPYVRGALELSLGNESVAKLHFEKVRKVVAPPAPPPPPLVPPKPSEPTVEEDGKQGVDQQEAPETTAPASATDTPIAHEGSPKES